MTYKVKRKGSGMDVPIWVWCVGVLTAYFILVEKKIVTINDLANGLGSGNEPVNATTHSRQESQNLMSQIKSRN